MSNDALIHSLAAGLIPVRRRSIAREGLSLALLCAMELALVLSLGLMRPDMGRMVGTAYMLWKLGSLALLSTLGCIVALRSFAPQGFPRRGLALVGILALVAVIAGLATAPAGAEAQPLLARLMPLHGLRCALAIVVLSLPVMALLGALMRRAAPVWPESSALASGLAAGSCGALVFAFCCPMNDPLYVITWYCTGCGVVMLAARWLLPRHFRL
jgi:hypothetical protein